jgi:oxygen-independent coproporphyrinogen-3 oxidase
MAAEGSQSRPISVYVHLPWCVRKCPYCDFNSHPLKGALPETDYVTALLRDFDAQRHRLNDRHIESVFFGGGTPSLFSADAFAQVLDRLRPFFSSPVEITLEVNPGTAEYHSLRGYHNVGINRLSLGAQSFDNAQLQRLGRIHNAEEIVSSYTKARDAGFSNINLDLMYGLPEQTSAAARADLSAAIALEPEHISWYQLTLEAKTEFARRPPILPVDATLADIEQDGYARLAAAGFGRYEVSAFAQRDRQCRHNVNYWSFGDYLGIGAGAHGKLTTQSAAQSKSIYRSRKASQPRLYLADPEAESLTTVATIQLPGEFMLNALRLTDGVALGQFEARTGLPLAALEPARCAQIADDLLQAGRLAATARGFAVLDSLIQEYI